MHSQKQGYISWGKETETVAVICHDIAMLSFVILRLSCCFFKETNLRYCDHIYVHDAILCV